MQKAEFLKKMREYDIALIYFTSPVSKKEKFHVGTVNFDDKYIQSKRKVTKVEKGKTLIFCYDTDSFRQIDVKAIQRVLPFNQEMEKTRGSRRSVANFK